VVDFDRTDLSVVSAALRRYPGFLAGWLSATPDVERLLADRLGVSGNVVQALLVCGAPRPQHFADDVMSVACDVGVDAAALAAALREATVLAALTVGRTDACDAPSEVLAAARDTATEAISPAQPTNRLRRLAAATWDAMPAELRHRSDVQGAIAWASPVAVVSLPRLTVGTVGEWLEGHGVAFLPAGDPGELRGLLVAWRGHGVIFVDGTLDRTEWRFTLGHEHGHFLLDYAEPRRRILREAPQLLAVVDGERQPASADRARAALAGVPLGVHTHLLHRDSDGGAEARTAIAEDEASLYALELLAPWDEVLDVLRDSVRPGMPFAATLRSAAAMVSERFGIPAGAALPRATAGLASLGIRRGFFEP
jgi:Zn-dependent peptidase ImmA (M78 family)